MLGCVGIGLNSYLDIKGINVKFKSFLLSFVLTVINALSLGIFNLLNNIAVINIKDIIFIVSFFLSTFFVIFVQSKVYSRLHEHNLSKTKNIVVFVVLIIGCCIVNLALIVNIGILIGVVLNRVFGVSLSLLV